MFLEDEQKFYINIFQTYFEFAHKKKYSCKLLVVSFSRSIASSFCYFKYETSLCMYNGEKLEAIH